MALTLFPTPDAEGIARTRELLRRKYGREISEDEAARLLGNLMRYMYLLRYLDGQLQEQRRRGLQPGPPTSTTASDHGNTPELTSNPNPYS